MVMKGGRSNIFSANDVLSFQSSLRTLLMFLCSIPQARRNILTWKVIYLKKRKSLPYHVRRRLRRAKAKKNMLLKSQFFTIKLWYIMCKVLSAKKRLNTMGKTLRKRRDCQKFCCTQYFMFIKIKREFKMSGWRTV